VSGSGRGKDSKGQPEWYSRTGGGTPDPVTTVEKAYKYVGYYMQRWKIEQVQYVLKSGCAIEKLPGGSIDKMVALILMYSIIAKKKTANAHWIATDWCESFLSTFGEDEHLVGKKYTVGLEGTNYRMRHRIRRGFRKTCCFLKKVLNHWKAFEMAFFYINHTL
jgi:hypothetical protein